MRLLLDTHIFLWAVMSSPLLKAGARKSIAAAEQVFVSSASIWEVAIKSRLGKIEADPEELLAAIDASGFVELPVSPGAAAPRACGCGPALHSGSRSCTGTRSRLSLLTCAKSSSDSRHQSSAAPAAKLRSGLRAVGVSPSHEPRHD